MTAGAQTADELKAKLIAAALNHRQYLTLRNTVFVLRGAGVRLHPEQERKVKEFEAVCKAWEEMSH